MPYASLQPAGNTLEEYRSSLVSWAIKAKGLGFKAAKLEATLTGPYAHEVSCYSDLIRSIQNNAEQKSLS